MAVTWTQVDEHFLQRAQEIIATYRPQLLDARIGFLMRSEAGKSQGRKVIGKAEKVSEKLQTLLELDFIIWLSKPDWLAFQPSQRTALLHHELRHCEYDADHSKASILGHDFEEFTEILLAHGLWRPDLEVVAQVIQPHLPGLEEKRGKLIALDPQLAEAATA